jgi:peptide/nickel transport system ATP-binding protein
MSTPALSVEDLSVWIETASGRRRVVDNISFSIKAGEAIGLVGESGCGKTMTAFAILGMLPVTGATIESAAIEINGRDISRLSTAQRRSILGRDVAMVFQQPGTALDPVFTIGQQITAVHRRHADGGKNSHRRAMLDSLAQVGFEQPEKIAAAYPYELSGGMRQLAMIAMATVCNPAVLIADEPTTALDSSTRALILQQIKRLQVDSGTAILLVSHDLSVIRQSCQNAMVMYCGRLLEKTDCQSLFAHARHPYSAGLISCIPQISARRMSGIKAIPGQVPAPSALPPGCHFAPRCGRAVPQCEQSVPALEPDHEQGVACFRPL